MENVITIALQRSPQSLDAVHASLDELERLVETARGRVVETHTQRRDRPDPATFIGRGKVAELARRVEQLQVRTLVFDDELRPAQQRNLEEAVQAKVVDRTRLILDIFAHRARTREGMLQVELAQLSYLLPRMTQRFGRFEQQVGGIGTRGPGERKLEVDRRRVRRRMAHLQEEIEKIRGERDVQRRVRRSIPVPQVALVGYTNAGKSTLLNSLLDVSAGGPTQRQHPVYADDKLFATLDPTTRRVRLPSGRIVLFSDTVGFIRKLPTQLVAAFRATLEEVATADLLVHVVDAADPEWREQEKAVIGILRDLGMDRLPRLSAFNKMDRLSPSQLALFRERDGVLLSASAHRHVGDFLKTVEDRLSAQWVEQELVLSYGEGARLAQAHQYLEVLSQRMTDDGIRLRVRGHPSTLAQWLKNEIGD